MMFSNKRTDNRMYRMPNNRSPFRGANEMPTRNMNQLMQPFVTKQQAPITSLATKGVDGISKTLNNVQQVLKVVQSTAPIIQEYGPMVKKLPMMYRMVKAFKEVENEDQAEIQQENKNQHVPEKEITPSLNEKYNGQPKPKLYI